MNSPLIAARTTLKKKERFKAAAKQMKTTLSELILASLEVATDKILSDQWECRRVYLMEGSIVGIGEEPPEMDGGVPMPMAAFSVVAPGIFWRHLERALSS